MITKNKLERQGFTRREIERLVALRGAWQNEQREEEIKLRRRLEFARWLVVNGRINEGEMVERTDNAW
jgi:hypothetical protein